MTEHLIIDDQHIHHIAGSKRRKQIAREPVSASIALLATRNLQSETVVEAQIIPHAS